MICYLHLSSELHWCMIYTPPWRVFIKCSNRSENLKTFFFLVNRLEVKRWLMRPLPCWPVLWTHCQMKTKDYFVWFIWHHLTDTLHCCRIHYQVKMWSTHNNQQLLKQWSICVTVVRILYGPILGPFCIISFNQRYLAIHTNGNYFIVSPLKSGNMAAL